MSDLIHSQSAYQPRIIPYLGDTTWEQIDRAQSLDPDVDLPREKVEELGTEGLLGWIADVPTVGCTLAQREYGELDIFKAIANKTGVTSVNLGDFKNSAFDLVAYLTDPDDNALATLWYPKQRLTGFSLTIGDPTALIDRSFECTGEDAILFQGNNKYLIFKKKTVASGDLGSGNTCAITVTDPVSVTDPVTSKEMLRVVKVRGTTTTELVDGTDFSVAGGILTVQSCQAGDVIKYWYTGASFVSSPSVPFTTNTSDLNAIRANSAVLYIGTANKLFKVQSATIDVTLDREDVREIGNDDVILRSVRSNTVTITLGKLLESDFTIEEVLSGQADGFGKIDSRELSTDLTFIVAIYEDSTQTSFKIGYKATTLTPTSFRPGTATIDTNVDSGVTLEGEDLLITTDIGDLGI